MTGRPRKEDIVVSNQVILDFLKAGLINVGGDDAKLEKLRETAADLADALKKTPSKTAHFALIAFDPEAPAYDPIIKDAVRTLESRWATYVNTFSGTPVTVLRAVLLDALVQAASENDNIGVALVTLARNALPFTEAGNERAIWSEVVSEIEKRIDARAEAEWATPESISVPPMTFQAPAIKVSTSPVSIDKAALVKKFHAAAGPQVAGQATDGNPYWPNNNQQWVAEFGNRLAETIANELGAIAKGSAIKPIDLSGPLEGLAQTVSAHVDGTLRAVSGATAGLQRRTNLIWWKETLYSPSARVSYRSMAPSTAAALMAFDLHRQVPTFSPASVSAFLHEVVLSLPSLKVDEKRAIHDFIMDALNSDELAPFRQAAAELVPEPVGRGPLLGIIGHAANRLPVDDRAFRDRVGVPASTKLTVPEWATWVFRELQAARATEQGTGTKKRERKT